VNLILGGQNVGKTSLLEAVWLGAGNVPKIENLPSIFRLEEEGDARRYFESVFLKNNLFCITLENEFDFYKTYLIDIDQSEFVEHGEIYKSFFGFGFMQPSLIPFNTLPISINPKKQNDAVLLMEDIVVKRKKRILLNLLEKIEVRLLDVNSLSLDSQRRIYVELDGLEKAIPLPQLGHGFSRLFYLYCSLLVTDSKLALIDEIENGIHYSSLPTMFKGIQQIATNNDIQSLITTHSWECICAAYNVFAEAGRLEDFQLIRLEQDCDNVRAILINDEDLDTIMEAGHEIR
jgi:AAA15 family ATPase/GTPase